MRIPLGIIASSIQTAPSVVPATYWYKLNETTGTTVFDYGNSGTPIDGTSSDALLNQPGHSANYTSYYFDQTAGSWVNLNQTNGVWGLNDFTISFWVKPSDASYVRLMSCADAGGTNGGWSIEGNADTMFYMYCGIGDGSFPSRGNFNIASDAWSNIQITKSSTAGFDYYVNNTWIMNTAYTSDLLEGTYLYLARNGSDTAYNLLGYMDDVRIFNSVLTSEQLSDVYSDGL